MTRVQMTLTGELAERFEDQKAEIEEELGHEISRPIALSLMMNGKAADEIRLIEQ
ncbi:hypothetical protein JZX76_11520 [Haloarcula hispanica]|uniref:hypothetical protein n=1 Tax=Haloarcula hispanica TaxID=51589 RepID=UPI0013EAD0B0|nr:hypothetical protein [Haloarcula hispanica]MCJ0620116.1 hypothetical protein [Haloarcula hispanica]